MASFPCRVLSARVDRIESYNFALAAAKKILVIGAGTVGVELVGEIVDHFPDKEVILIHSNAKVMNRSPSKATEYVESYMRKNNVTLILGEKIVSQSGKKM
jgi:NADH dehydrogenase FAD-containing subunit